MLGLLRDVCVNGFSLLDEEVDEVCEETEKETEEGNLCVCV